MGWRYYCLKCRHYHNSSSNIGKGHARYKAGKTGQTGKSNKSRDKKRKAKKPGRRVSKSGNVYYENRRNRSDKGEWL